MNKSFPGFQIVKSDKVKELDCDYLELVHEKSGAKVIHIQNKDPENLFCLSFKTIPETSNGVAHVLEHTVLCGSKKFPIKDPFFAMTRRSLHTFMNALTGADFTCYPAATQVEKDFYNLLDVYIDAVFHPKIEQQSFLQEGIRLELVDPNNLESPIEYKGIVYNEMKGALSSGSSRLIELMNHELFPDITYGINSGGDPKVIPQLTYEELKQFHEKFYHPSQCLFFFYGSLPLEKHLKFIDEAILSRAEKRDPIPLIPQQKRFLKPKSLTEYYPIAADEDTAGKTLISVGWLTTNLQNSLDILGLTVLAVALMDTDASPLKMALLKSGLCNQAIAMLDSELAEIPIIISLRGCNKGDEAPLLKIILDTFEKYAKEGLPHEIIESALHHLELQKSEITSDGYPFGLNLFMRSALLQQHGADPLESLKIHEQFDELRDKIQKEPNWLSNLLRTYFIENPHRVSITLIPDPSLLKKEIDEEKAHLAHIAEKLSLQEKQKIADQTKDLENFQRLQELEDVSVLPHVGLEDVAKSPITFPLEIRESGTIKTFLHDDFTNGILYTDLIFPLPFVPEDELFYMRLLAVFIGQLGAGGKSYEQTLHEMQAYTGGITATLSLNSQCHDFNHIKPTFHLKGKALNREKEKIFTLTHDIVKHIDFDDTRRVKEVLMKHFTGLQSSLVQLSLKYATQMSGKNVTLPAKISDKWFGLDYYYFIKNLVENISDLSFIDKLKNLAEKIFYNSQPHLVLSGDKKIILECEKAGYYGLNTLSHKNQDQEKWDYSLGKQKPQGRIISSQVAFICQVLKSVPYTHDDAPALALAANLFDNITLHSKIREQGGAYGAGAIANVNGGTFSFYSYRDPNTVETLNAFEEAVRTVINGEFSEEELLEAKLELIQVMDSPVSPGARADIAYNWLREGRTTEIRQKYRNKALSMTREDVIYAVKTHIETEMKNASPAIFAGKNQFEKANLDFEIKPI